MNINNQKTVLEGFKNRIDHLEEGRKATLARMSGEELMAHIQSLARRDRNDQIIDV